jgi:TetR/AcrR family transcriptional repressor of nem operon
VLDFSKRNSYSEFNVQARTVTFGRGVGLVGSKKEDIICKTSSLMHSRGYENTKLSDILSEAGIGKGQFYHYFTSKRDLANSVIDYLISDMNRHIFEKILDKDMPPKVKLNQMLDEICYMQAETEGKRGCPIGNLAIEISEHDPMFREKISSFFDQWEEKIKKTLDEMKQQGELDPQTDTLKMARAMVAMIEGAILRMKSKQDVQVLRDIIDVLRKEYQLNQM